MPFMPFIQGDYIMIIEIHDTKNNSKIQKIQIVQKFFKIKIKNY